jgi:phage FluMu gp28-like protein
MPQELLTSTDWQRIQRAHEQGRVSDDEILALTRYHCEHDGLFWLKYVVTRDEADPNHAVKPFPLGKEYIRQLWWVLDHAKFAVVAKSRQMMVSWCVAAHAVWWARFKANQAVYYQTKSFEDAMAMVAMPEGGFEGRCQFIESHLPDWLQTKCKISEGRIQYPNGSIIQALAGGADKIRGKTASRIFQDEFAFADDQDGVYSAVAPLRQNGAAVFFISTPNGSSNLFATLYHGRDVGRESSESVKA